MKNELSIFLSILVAVICAVIPYFFNYITLPFAIIIFLLALLILTNIFSSYRLSRIEKDTERNALALNVIIDSFIKIERISRTKEITLTQFIDTFCEGVESIFSNITKDYFSTHSSNPSIEVERRKQELLERARQRKITYEEGQELQKLLEEQKRQHEASGDIGSAILLGLLILFLLGVLVALFGKKKRD